MYAQKYTVSKNPGMLRRLKKCMVIMACSIIFPVILAGCDDTPEKKDMLRPVQTIHAPVAQSVPAATWSGTIEPAEEITLHFRIDGKLASRPVDVGALVERNQTVATLTGSQSPEEVKAILAEFQDALAAEKKGLQELERTKKLYAIGTASRAQLEEATASVTALNARKTRALAQKSAALNESGFSALKAPFDGIVTLFTSYPGQSVTAGQDVIKIASRRAEVQFSVSSAIASSLHEGDFVSVIAGNAQHSARIRYISPQLDANTRTSLVRATLLSQDGIPLYGSVVSIQLSMDTDKVIPVPASALTRTGNKPIVFVVNPGSHKLEVREVTLKRYSADQAYITSGIKAGELVIIAGVSTLSEGEKVAIRPEAMK